MVDKYQNKYCIKSVRLLGTNYDESISTTDGIVKQLTN